VKKLVLIGASVYAEGTGKLATLPRAVAYAGVNISPIYYIISGDYQENHTISHLSLGNVSLAE